MGTNDVSLTIEEAAQFLNISRATVYRLVKKGLLEKVKEPGHRAWKVTMSSLDAYDIASNMTLPEIAARLARLERKVEFLLTRSNSVTEMASVALDYGEMSQELRKRHPELVRHKGFGN